MTKAHTQVITVMRNELARAVTPGTRSPLTRDDAEDGAQIWVAVDDPVIVISIRETGGEGAVDMGSLDEAATSVLGGELICRFVAEPLLPGKLLAPDLAKGLLISSLNVPEGYDDEFNAWCSTEHLPRLSQVPGVLAARRYTTTVGVQRYVNVYHLASPEIQVSEAWKAAADTPWSSRLRPHFQDKFRVVAGRAG